MLISCLKITTTFGGIDLVPAIARGNLRKGELNGEVCVVTGAGRGIGLEAARSLAWLGAKVVIAQHPRRAKPLDIDREMYKWRRLIENFFGKLKEFKRVAMRSDKMDGSFAAMIHLAAAVINSR